MNAKIDASIPTSWGYADSYEFMERVQKGVRIAHELNRDIATPEQARRMLGISATPTRY